MTDIAGGLRKPFAEQIAALRLRLGNRVPTARWTDLWQSEHDRAFVVAGALKADLLADLARAVERAVAEGTGLEAFRADFRALVARHGWHGWTGEGTGPGEAWRTRVIYRTNMATSYAAGRMAQLVEGGFAFWVYRHGGSLDPRLEHLSWDGVILPADHPFWRSHAPPNGWGCRCFVTGARTEAGAVRLGGKPGKTLPDHWQRIDPKTGTPEGIDRGWDYAPGASATDLIREKLAKLPPRIGADLAADVAAPGPGPNLPYMEYRDARTTAAALEALLASGAAGQVSAKSSMRLAGINQMVRTSMEIHQRFDLPPASFLGHFDDHPRGRVKLPRTAPACYVPSTRALLFRSAALDAAYVERAFGGPLAAARVTGWQGRVAKAAPEVQTRAARIGRWVWSTITGVRDIVGHEWGHHFHFSDFAAINDLIARHRMLEEGWADLVSEYGTTNRQEFVAEAFNLYLHGGEDQWYRLHPALLAHFRQRDRLAK